MRRFLTVLLFSAIGAGAQAQRLDPGDYIYPIRDVARLYSANFGEMRPGHFHAGTTSRPTARRANLWWLSPTATSRA